MNETIDIAVHKPSRQQGVALIVSLLMLLILTLIGVTAMLMTTLEEKMSGNQRDRSLAFQAAESALRAGEEEINRLMNPTNPNAPPPLPAFNCTNATTCPLADVTNASVWGQGSLAYSYSGDLSNPGGPSQTRLANQPQYLIEVMNNGQTIAPPALPGLRAGTSAGLGANICYFRITARGVGGTSTAVVIVQSNYVSHPNTTTGACHG